MRAVVYSSYGTADRLQLREVERPVADEGEVLVRVQAASINDWDLGLLTGTPFANRVMYGLFRPQLRILGSDIAGRVEALGPGVTRWRPGDEVFGDLCASGWGGFAEYVAVGEDVLTRKPANLSFAQAAAIPQAGLLALQGLCHKGHIRPGQRVLINGASGGVGPVAIQIAKALDAEVTGVCSAAKMELVRGLGADQVIDYRAEDFTRNGQQYDLILDAKAKHSIFAYRRALSPGGCYVMLGGVTSSINQVLLLGPLLSLFGGQRLGLLFYRPNQGLEVMRELLETGVVVPQIDRCYPLEETAEAMRYYAAGKARGKVVITVA